MSEILKYEECLTFILDQMLNQTMMSKFAVVQGVSLFYMKLKFYVPVCFTRVHFNHSRLLKMMSSKSLMRSIFKRIQLCIT